MFSSVQTEFTIALALAMIVYLIKGSPEYSAFVFGLVCFATNCHDSHEKLEKYRYPYCHEPAYWFIPEWFLRGIGLSFMIVTLTFWMKWTSLWVLVSGVGGLLYGYAMQFDFERNTVKHNEILRAVGMSLIVLAIVFHVGLSPVNILFFTLGTFLVTYLMWLR